MKILSIGNSFSQDAHKWLSQIASAYGTELKAVNLYIGGCSLETHFHNWQNDTHDYSLEVNGVPERNVSILQALREETCDVITFQQASHYSGDFATYMPYLAELYRAVKEHAPAATYCIQQTWAYETDSTHWGFAAFDHDQDKMHAALSDAYKQASDSIGCPLIPVGDVIAYLRHHCKAFDYKDGGLSLNRDGFHLSHLYGRYAAALTWYAFLQNADVHEVRFVPTYEGVTADTAILAQIGDAVMTVLNQKL